MLIKKNHTFTRNLEINHTVKNLYQLKEPRDFDQQENTIS